MSILKLKDSQGNWVGVPTIKGDTGNGISSAILNDDYTLTLTFTDGTTYKTPSIRGEKGEKGEPATDMDIHICSASEYDAETRIPTIANPNDKTFYLVPTEDGTSPDLFTEWIYVNGAWEMFGSASVDLSGYLTDVQIGGQSIVEDGVAEIPIANDDTFGTVKIATGGYYGINYYGDNDKFKFLKISYAQHGNDIKRGMLAYKPITPTNQHESVFYGLAKAAEADEKDSELPVGQYTDNAKDAIQNMLGITPLIASHETDPFESNHVVGELFIISGKLYRAKTALVAGEYINEGTNVEIVDVAEVLDDTYVKNTDYAGDNYGLIKVKIGDHGLTKSSNGFLQVYKSSTNDIKNGTNTYRPITPYNQHESVFYGLAKTSGDSTQSASSNAVGTYTDEAKASIQTMLGVPSSDDVVSDVQINGSSIVSDGVANVPVANGSSLGVVGTNVDRGIGIDKDSGRLYIHSASIGNAKAGGTSFLSITPYTQHASTFYGLAKAAGHDEKDSTLPVGTYTSEAKSAIKQMLSIADNYDSFIVDVEGTDPTITGQPSYRYNCGEVLSLTVTPPETGTIDFRFTSGSSPTVLTLPSTVKMPEWWVEVEANTVYEMCITDGVYCGVMSWAM